MKPFVKILKTILFIIFVSAIHIVLAQLLPFPFSKIHFAFAFLTLFFLKHRSGMYVWHIFFSSIILEQYVLTPFGVSIASATLASLITYWLYQYMFTNRSLPASMGLMAIFLCIFRGLYTLILLITATISAQVTFSFDNIVNTALWEIVLTSIFLGMWYMLYIRSIRGRAYIQSAYEG